MPFSFPALFQETSNLPRTQNQVNDVVYTSSFLSAREDRGFAPPRELRIPVHDIERCRYQRGGLDLHDRETKVIKASRNSLY